jgi:histidine triad (HIT) family protein
MEPTIFTKIINGEIPSHKVYEDEFAYAIMDIQPIQPGMVVVISKSQIDKLEDLPIDNYLGMWSVVRKVTHALRESFSDSERVGVMVEGLEVPHAHIKVFPFSTSDEYRAGPYQGEPMHDELAKQAELIKGAIDNGQ